MRFTLILFTAVANSRYLSPNYNEKSVGEVEVASNYEAMDEEQQLYSYKTEQDVDNEDFSDLDEEELLDFEEQEVELEEEEDEEDIDAGVLDEGGAQFPSKSTPATSDIAIFNSIWDPCSKNPIASGKTSDFGCGDGLVCDRLFAQNNPYLQCLPNDSLKRSLADGTDTCPISQLNVSGRKRGTSCAAGSFCTGREDWAVGTCKACRSNYSTCGSSAYQHADSTLCCPGRYKYSKFLLFSLKLKHTNSYL